MLSMTPKAIANIAKNRLVITITGKLSKANLDKLYTEIRFCVADLKPGFGVITDLSDCTIAALSGVPTFRKITNFLITNKVGRVVRVIDEKKVVLKQLINMTARMSGYKADHFHSLSEAENALSQSDRRDSLRFVLHQHSVKFSMNSSDGNGLVQDISTSGCAIKTKGDVPAIHDQIIISITFNSHGELITTLECKAEVIWVDGVVFAMRFADMDNERKEQLWERLVHESKCELP